MAPLVIQAAGGSATKEFKKESGYARLLGSGRPPALCIFMRKVMSLGSAGVAELAIFHPVPFFMTVKCPGEMLILLLGRYNCEAPDEQPGKGRSFHRN